MTAIDGVDALAGKGALMGLDPGTKTIGVAVSDGLQMTATALETIKRRKFAQDAARLAEIVQGRGIVGVVVGLPLNMDGSEGPRAQSALSFAGSGGCAIRLNRTAGAVPLRPWSSNAGDLWAGRVANSAIPETDGCGCPVAGTG